MSCTLKRIVPFVLGLAVAGTSIAGDPMGGKEPGSYLDLLPVTSSLFPVAKGWVLASYGHVQSGRFWGAQYTVLPGAVPLCTDRQNCENSAGVVNFELRDEARRCKHEAAVTEEPANGPARFGVSYVVADVTCSDDWGDWADLGVPNFSEFRGASKNSANTLYAFLFTKDGEDAGFPEGSFAQLRNWLLTHGWESIGDGKSRYGSPYFADSRTRGDLGVVKIEREAFAHPTPTKGVCFLETTFSLATLPASVPLASAGFKSCCGPLGTAAHPEGFCGYAVKPKAVKPK